MLTQRPQCGALGDGDLLHAGLWNETATNFFYQKREAAGMVQVFKPFMPFTAAWLAATSVFHFAPAANCFISTFVFLVCMSQQFHAWGHMKKSELPKPVIALQVGIYSPACIQYAIFAY